MFEILGIMNPELILIIPNTACKTAYQNFRHPSFSLCYVDRQYWLSCFEDSLPKFTDRAVQSQLTPSNAEQVNQRADRFKEVFLQRIRNLRSQPYAHGSLTVRNILDMREQCLSEYGFLDPYLNQKILENEHAFGLLAEVLTNYKALSAMELIEQVKASHMQLFGYLLQK